MQAARALRLQAPRLGRLFASVAVEAPAGSYLPADVVRDRVLNVLKSIKYSPADVTLEHKFVSEMQFDSGIRQELYEKLSDEFCIALTAADKEKFVDGAAAANFFAKHPKAR